MQESVGKSSIVGEQQHAAALEIEPAHRVQPPACTGHQVADGRAPLGVRQGAHHTARLVEYDGPGRPSLGEALAVDRDHVPHGIGARAELAHHHAVHADAPRADQLLRGAPRCDPTRAQDLL
jgi:hypothetical protein